jgi:DNA-binding NarL/FixJ family response regulator
MTPLEQMHASAAETRAALRAQEAAAAYDLEECPSRKARRKKSPKRIEQLQREAAAMDRVISGESRLAGMPEGMIRGRQTSRRVYAVRCRVIAKAHREGLSDMAIGRALNRDHTTILHALKKMGLK